jgi:hypothetical protein
MSPMSVLEERNRSATARAVCEVDAEVIPKGKFLDKISIFEIGWPNMDAALIRGTKSAEKATEL